MIINRWHFVLSGFTQSEARLTGCMKLWRKIHHHCPNTRAELRKWSDDFAAVAEWIHLCRNGQTPDVVISGYSFGGFSGTILAKELRNRGLGVRALVLCDPVYRHWYRAGWWRSLMPWSTIEIPDNVQNVYLLRQDNDRFSTGRSGGWIQPAGHDIVLEDDKKTVLHPEIVLASQHAYMDDAPEFHEISLKVSQCDTP